MQLPNLFPPFPVPLRDCLPPLGKETLQDASLQVRLPPKELGLDRWDVETGHSWLGLPGSVGPENWVWARKVFEI